MDAKDIGMVRLEPLGQPPAGSSDPLSWAFSMSAAVEFNDWAGRS